MYNFFMFLPRCFFYVISMGGWNWFPKARTDVLPDQVHQVYVALVYGTPLKALKKEMDKILGPDLENTVGMISGFDPYSIYRGTRGFDTTEEILEKCQGLFPTEREEMFGHSGPGKVRLLVSGDVLAQLEKCKCFTTYNEQNVTEDVIERLHKHRLEAFTLAAIAVLQSTGELEKECSGCETTISEPRDIDSWGDCRRCDCHLVNEGLISETAEKLSKEAA